MNKLLSDLDNTERKNAELEEGLRNIKDEKIEVPTLPNMSDSDIGTHN